MVALAQAFASSIFASSAFDCSTFDASIVASTFASTIFAISSFDMAEAAAAAAVAAAKRPTEKAPWVPRYGVTYMSSERSQVREKMEVQLWLDGPNLWIPFMCPLTTVGKWAWQYPGVPDVKEALKEGMPEWLEDVPVECIHLYAADERVYPPRYWADELEDTRVINEKGRTMVFVDWPQHVLKARKNKILQSSDGDDLQEPKGSGYYTDKDEPSDKTGSYWTPLNEDEKTCWRDAYDKGFDRGFDKGHDKGYDSGWNHGYNKGFAQRGALASTPSSTDKTWEKLPKDAIDEDASAKRPRGGGPSSPGPK